MKSAFPLLASLLGLILLPGCLELSEPLSDPVLAAADSNLCGKWNLSPDGQGMPQYIFVGVHPGEEGTPQGMMDFTGVSYDETNKKLETMQFSFFTTELNGAHYVNLLGGEVKPDLSSRQGYDAWKAQSVHQVLIVKYELKDGQLSVWMGDDQAFKALKEDKTIDNTTASVIAYIKKFSDSRLFPDATKSVYRQAH